MNLSYPTDITEGMTDAPHGSVRRYWRGCRCIPCKDANNEYAKALRWKRDGEPIPRTALGRFWAKVDKSGECWLWTAGVDGSGYGTFKVDRRTWRVHRWIYLVTFGSLDKGLTIDHLCNVRTCVNPAHLEAVSAKENTARGAARRTHCRRGHEYTEATVYWNRSCKVCWKVPKGGRR